MGVIPRAKITPAGKSPTNPQSPPRSDPQPTNGATSPCLRVQPLLPARSFVRPNGALPNGARRPGHRGLPPRHRIGEQGQPNITHDLGIAPRSRGRGLARVQAGVDPRDLHGVCIWGSGQRVHHRACMVMRGRRHPGSGGIIPRARASPLEWRICPLTRPFSSSVTRPSPLACSRTRKSLAKAATSRTM
jgi:hypothetical protein